MHYRTKGNEAERLVKLLRDEYPEARKLLTQPSVLKELWIYAETGRFRQAKMENALRPLTETSKRAGELAEAIRSNQWRAMRDERQTHYEFLRLEAQLLAEFHAGQNEMLERIREELSGLRAALPAARQLPAQTAPFVDREREIADGELKLKAPAVGHVAVVLNCSGMAGTGKSVFALELAYRQADRFAGGVLYCDMRTADGRPREAADVAGRLLRDLGIAPDTIPPNQERRLALFRSTCALTPVMLVLDNVSEASQPQLLVPAHGESVVLITSRTPLQALATAGLVELLEMADEDSMMLLERIIGQRVSDDREAAATIVRCCAGLPLALGVIAGRVRAQPYQTLAEVARRLAESPDVLADIDDRAGTACGRRLADARSAQTGRLEPCCGRGRRAGDRVCAGA
jgi:hypothetical protein